MLAPPLAIGLPDSPVAAVLLLLALMAVTYALVTTFIKVGVPSPSGGYADEEPDEPDDENVEPVEVKGLDAPDPDWASETVPSEEYLNAGAEPPVAHEEPEVAREPLAVQTVRVRDHYLTIGDTASFVMAAFRRGEGETMPLVERNAAGQACYVSRTYRVGRRPLTIVLERDNPDDPLRLVRIEIGQ